MYKFITKQVAVNIFKIWLPGLAPEPFGKRSSDLNKTENIISISGKQAHLLFLDEVRKTKGLFGNNNIIFNWCSVVTVKPPGLTVNRSNYRYYVLCLYIYNSSNKQFGFC